MLPGLTVRFGSRFGIEQPRRGGVCKRIRVVRFADADGSREFTRRPRCSIPSMHV